MVSLSVTRLVVSGGSSATGRRCDVVSVTELRSIANISLLMRDIDRVDPENSVRDLHLCSARCSSGPGLGRCRVSDWMVRLPWSRDLFAAPRAGWRPDPRGEPVLPTLCDRTFVDYREKPIRSPSRSAPVPSERMDSLAAVLAAIR